MLPPILAVFGMSVFRIELLKPGPATFIGLNNFTIRHAGRLTNFLASIPRTILFAAGTTIITVPLAVGAALIMNRRWRFATLIGVALLLPWAIAPVVTGFYWRFMFQPTFGVMTNIANLLGLADGTVPWLQDTDTAMGIAVIATAWRTVPLLAPPPARGAQDDPRGALPRGPDGRRRAPGSRSASSPCRPCGRRC